MYLILAFLLFISGSAFAKELGGLNALVTGGSRGIGEACALSFAREGANVAILVNKSTEEAEKVAKKIKDDYGVDAFVCACDVANPKQVETAVESVVGRWGRIDILVNNAGIAGAAPCEEMAYDDWHRMIEVNLTGVFLCSQAAGKKMIEHGNGGSIINISSICGHIVVLPQKQCHYNAAKGGVGMLTKSLAVEWAKYGIRVNAISPGYIKTGLLEPSIALHSTWIDKTPQKTLGEPGDIAEAVLYLASPKSKFVTGADWIIDGGYVCP
ncbi:MAG TPA: SDR family oxidoreductase [Rhabdochlamydiaceae bacterium]|nr:SDR family oxidoreductase [Rhabdochlamydiaceae bacterium]